MLLKNNGLVKTIRFKNPRYIGDPINAVKIFNDLKVDELVFLDISATPENRCISVDLVKNIGDEAFMPFAAGGGITSFREASEIINNGAEKVVINTGIIKNPKLLNELAGVFGNQSIIAAVDINMDIWGKYRIFSNHGQTKSSLELVPYLKMLEAEGAGEILINAIHKDGTKKGFDLDLIKIASETVRIPVIASGGASNLSDLNKAVKTGGAMAVAAGSIFVYHGARDAVLINYPTQIELLQLFNEN